MDIINDFRISGVIWLQNFTARLYIYIYIYIYIYRSDVDARTTSSVQQF